MGSSTTNKAAAPESKPRRKIRKTKRKEHASKKEKHHHHHHHHQQHQEQLDQENVTPVPKQKSFTRLSTVHAMRNEAMFARTPDVASESVDERISAAPALAKAKKPAVAFVGTPLGKAVARADDTEHDTEHDDEPVVVVTDSLASSRQGSGVSKSSRADAESATALATDDDDDADDVDDDGYKTTLLHLAFAGLDNSRAAANKRQPSKKRERAAGVTLPSSTPTIAITPAVLTTATAAAAPPKGADAQQPAQVVTVSLAAYSAMQNEANELRAQVAALQKQVSAQNGTIETMSATMQEMQAELARARQAAKQAALTNSAPAPAPAPVAPAPIAVAVAAPQRVAMPEPELPLSVIAQQKAKASRAKAAAPADAVSSMLKASHATRARGQQSGKPRTSLPKPGKVEGLRTFWKEKSNQK